jgi:uncharacterized alkaline shock family protein YloU
MDDQLQSESTEALDVIHEDSGMGSISINNEVVAQIVAMATREVAGVVGLASGGLKDDIAGLFGGRRDIGSAISISETAEGSYHIGIKVILYFGVQLAKVAQEIQRAVREQVENMTNKDVAKVDVIVDGVRSKEVEKSGSDNDASDGGE